MNTSLPERSSTVLIAGPSGPVTTISLMPLYIGAEKSTSFWRSGVTVRSANTTSPQPSTSLEMIVSRLTGRKMTCSLIVFDLSCLLRSLSSAWKMSYEMPRWRPCST
jgi:hypothetical protein